MPDTGSGRLQRTPIALGMFGSDQGAGTGSVAPLSSNVIITEDDRPITTENDLVLITETEVW